MSITSEIRLRVRKEGDVVLNQLSAKLNDLASRSTLTTSKFNDLAATLKTTDSQIRTKSINGLNDYARAWRELANSVDITSAEFKQATAEALKFESAAAKAQGRRTGGGLARAAQTAGSIAASGVFGGPEGLIGAGIGAIAGGPLGAATGGAIGAQVGMFRQQLAGTATYAAEIAKQRQALQLVTKDASEYARALAFIDQTSSELAIPQDVLTRQFTQLTASVKGAGGTVEDAEKAFIGVASGIRGTGGSLEQLDSALLATTQVFSKGKVSAEELRQQIGERLPGAFSLFAESMGKTPQELDKALEKGQVSLQDFQNFAVKLFDEYGENAKIIADGPDAAGDRLRTSLSNLSESVGTLLKPIGAGFQNTFASIITIIDQATRKLIDFLGLGKGRTDEIRKLRNDIATTDERLKAFAQARLRQGGELDPAQYSQEQTMLKRRTRLDAQLKALQAAEEASKTAKSEPTSKLPGILPDGKNVQKEAEKLAKIAQQTFNQTLQQLGIDVDLETRKGLTTQLLDLESQMTDAIKAGNEEEKKRIQFAIENAGLLSSEEALLKEREKLEKLITDAKSKGLDTTDATNKLNALNATYAENQLKQKQLYNKELEYEESLMKKLLEDYYSKFTYGGEATAMPTIFQAFTDQIKELRMELEAMMPKLTQIAEGVSNSFASAFDNMVFKATSAKDSLSQLFNDIARVFEEMVLKMISDYLQMQIMTFFQNIFAPSPVSVAGGYFSGGGSSIFSSPSFGIDSSGLTGPTELLSSSLSYGGIKFANGGIMTANGPLALKRYAAGGIANSPQLAMFGEGSTPEAYVPLPDGRSIPVTMNSAEPGNITVNVDAKGSSVEGNQTNAGMLGQALGAAVQAELIRQKRPGGLLA